MNPQTLTHSLTLPHPFSLLIVPSTLDALILTPLSVMSASALLDEGISGQGNRAKEYFPSDTYPTQSGSGSSWWEKTNWFRVQSQQPSNQPTLPIALPATSMPLPASAAASSSSLADSEPSGQLRRRYFHHHADVVEYGGVGGEVEAAYRTHILKSDTAAAADSIVDAPGHAVCFNRFLTSRTPTPVAAPPIATASAPANQTLPLANAATATAIKPHRPTKRQVIVQAAQGYSRSVCQQLQEYVLLPLLQPGMFARLGITASRGVLLTGESGSGKSRLIEAMVDQLGIYFHSLNGANLAAGDGSGAVTVTATVENDSNQQLTVIDRVFKAARKHAPAIIFIDDIDAITPPRTAADSPLLTKLRASLRHNIDALSSHPPPQPVVLVGACTAASAVCPSLLRHGRFDRVVVLNKPDVGGRRRMLAELAKGMAVGEDVELDEVAKRTEGFVGSDLMALCREAGMECVRQAMREQRRRDREEMAEPEDEDMEGEEAYSMPHTLTPSLLSSLAVQQSHFLSALTLIKPAAARSFAGDIAPMSWSALGGHDTIKSTLTESISLPMSHSSLFRHFNLSSSSSTLLYGPSGCGKTALARCVASTYGLSFVSVKGPELLNSYLGESEKAVRDLFSRARAASPCVLFMDELDAIATRRGLGNDATVDRVINQLLIEMDGAHTHSHSTSSSSSSSAPAPPLLFLLAATNRPELLDPAILRPGRFDQLLYVPLPSSEERVDIARACMTDTPVGSDVMDEGRMRGWAERMAGYSGADIAGVFNGARRLAVRDELSRRSAAPEADKAAAAAGGVVTVEHIEQSLAGSRASVDETDLARYDYFQRVMSRTGEHRQGQPDSDEEDDEELDELHGEKMEEGDEKEQEEKQMGDELDEKEEEKKGAAGGRRPMGELERIRRRVRSAVVKEMAAGSNPQQALNNVLRRFNTGTGKRRVGVQKDESAGEDVKENDEEVALQDRRPRRPIVSGMTAM